LNLKKGFQNGEIGPVLFSKRRDWACPVFKTGEIGLDQFPKVLSAALKNFLSNKSKRFKLTRFRELWVNYKDFGNKRLRTPHTNTKLKGQL
jgi:hypothetical protein